MPVTITASGSVVLLLFSLAFKYKLFKIGCSIAPPRQTVAPEFKNLSTRGSLVESLAPPIKIRLEPSSLVIFLSDLYSFKKVGPKQLGKMLATPTVLACDLCATEKASYTKQSASEARNLAKSESLFSSNPSPKSLVFSNKIIFSLSGLLKSTRYIFLFRSKYSFTIF